MSTHSNEEARLVTPGEAARLLGMTPQGVVAASNRGDLPVAVRTQTGRRLYSHVDLATFASRRAARRKED